MEQSVALFGWTRSAAGPEKPFPIPNKVLQCYILSTPKSFAWRETCSIYLTVVGTIKYYGQWNALMTIFGACFQSGADTSYTMTELNARYEQNAIKCMHQIELNACTKFINAQFMTNTANQYTSTMSKTCTSLFGTWQPLSRIQINIQ